MRRSHRRRLPDTILESSVVRKTREYVPSFPSSLSGAKRGQHLSSSAAIPSPTLDNQVQCQDQRSPLTTTLLGDVHGDSTGKREGSSFSHPKGDKGGENLSSTSNGHDITQTEKAFGDFNSFVGGSGGGDDYLHITGAVAAKPKGPEAPDLTLTEFLRVNMRLAEDRVLSFVLVFCTGFGTKWVPGATFYYSPEVTFQTLLTQRRRWINGTVASYFYFFTSQRARLRVQGGFFVSARY